MTAVTTATPAGLVPLNLRSTPRGPGAPTLRLFLLAFTPKEKVTGYAEVTQALQSPIVCLSHVNGVLIWETVMPPGKSAVRIDLTGYPEIVWPDDGGIGPVIGQNFKAMVVLDTHFTEGTVRYEYQSRSGEWVREEQPISRVD
jgi:hypothetical protein